MTLHDNVNGGYNYLEGIDPYSAGVVAMPGYEIIHVTLRRPLPYRLGFKRIDELLAEQERPRSALCAVELRLPAPLPFDGFTDFNHGYRTLLSDWDLLRDGRNPIARTNIAPEVQPPAEPSLYAFSYTRPCEPGRSPTFIVAGAGELNDQAVLQPSAVVRAGETSADALNEKAACVMQAMHDRLHGLGRSWDDVTTTNVYTTQPLQIFLKQALLDVTTTPAIHGLHWHYSHPPIADLVFEMDIRGVHREFFI